MAVMKTFCGCMSTRSGAMTVLLLFLAVYLVGIILFSIQLSGDEFHTWYNTEIVKDDNNCLTGEHKDSWWCQLIQDTKSDINAVLIVGIILCSLLFVAVILAIFGISKGKAWLIVPWISMKFAVLVIGAVIFGLTIILMSVYWSVNEDSSTIIAVGIIGAAITAFLFYVWLCVVSHFQLLRELDKLGLSSLEHVEPFHNEDGDTTMDENDDDYPTKSNLDNPNDEAYNPQDENPTLTDTVSLEDAVIDDFEVAEKRIE